MKDNFRGSAPAFREVHLSLAGKQIQTQLRKKPMQNLREQIMTALHNVAEMQGIELVAQLDDDTILLESGLDSLGFAILVAQLEEDLGYDPFVLMDVPVYPKTLSEFTLIYQRFAPK
jgi:acyl carrier protein